MHIRFVGCGDAFGSGARLNTCFQAVGSRVNFLIDIGASSLIGLKAQGVKQNDIRSIFVTHFHADHFGGIPFFVLDAQFFAQRSEPLTIVGPVGLRMWYERVMESSFPGASTTMPKFNLEFIELRPRQQTLVDEVVVTPFQAAHGEPGGPFFAYRFEAEGKCVAYTGDTEWTDELIDAGCNADLLIAEGYFLDKKVKWHLDIDTLKVNLDRIRPKRLVLTHMSEDVLNRPDTLPFEAAADGLILEL